MGMGTLAITTAEKRASCKGLLQQEKEEETLAIIPWCAMIAANRDIGRQKVIFS
jgi:hypothetical protein